MKAAAASSSLTSEQGFDTGVKVTSHLTALASPSKALLSGFEADQKKIESLILDFIQQGTTDWDPKIPSVSHVPLLAIRKSIANSAGKRIRPQLAFWFARYFCDQNKQKEDIIKAGVAVEILHAASLAIDDIQDGSLERRGGPSLAAQYGMPSALNSASLCYFLALDHFPSNSTKELAQKTLIECHLGQGLDLMCAQESFVDEWICLSSEEKIHFYNQIAELKTASLIKLIGSCAGVVSNQNTIWQGRVNTLLTQFGILFQILDDLKNLSPELSGSKAFEDLGSPLRNRVFLILLGHLNPKETEEIHFLLKQQDTHSLKSFILQHPKFHTALSQCIAIAKSIDATIHNELNILVLPDSECKAYLIMLFQKQFDVLNYFAAPN